MAQRKTERLMNLFFLLLSTTQYLTKAQIRQSIADYRDSSDVAFERNFERDKEELRDIGVEVELGDRDRLLGGDVGYRIPRDASELPHLAFTREEAAVIGLAAQIWDNAALAGEAQTALVKLKSIGIDLDTTTMRMPEPRLAAQEPAFAAFLDAATTRRLVTFDYQVPGRDQQTRRLQTWSLLSWRGRWYASGFDLGREAPRVFRLDRVVGSVTVGDESSAYEIPSDVSPGQLVNVFDPPEDEQKAVVRVAPGRAVELRRRAVSVSAGDGGDVISFPFTDTVWTARAIASYGADVKVLEPPSLQDAVIAALRAVPS